MVTHKDLDIWKLGIELVEEVYKITAQFPKEEVYGLASQMRRAAVSIPSNISEGAARNSKNLERPHSMGIDQRRGNSENIVSRLSTFKNPLRGERRSSMRTAFFVILLLSVLMVPFSAKAQNQPVTVEEVHQFMNEYKDRYVNMNYEGFMDLFSKEAVENRMYPYADIREAYRKVFDISNAIQYNLEIYTIQVSQESAFVSGRYELVQSFKGSKKSKVFRGNIQWNLNRENGVLKIREINYGRDR